MTPVVADTSLRARSIPATRGTSLSSSSSSHQVASETAEDSTYEENIDEHDSLSLLPKKAVFVKTHNVKSRAIMSKRTFQACGSLACILNVIVEKDDADMGNNAFRACKQQARNDNETKVNTVSLQMRNMTHASQTI